MGQLGTAWATGQDSQLGSGGTALRIPHRWYPETWIHEALEDQTLPKESMLPAPSKVPNLESSRSPQIFSFRSTKVLELLQPSCSLSLSLSSSSSSLSFFFPLIFLSLQSSLSLISLVSFCCDLMDIGHSSMVKHHHFDRVFHRWRFTFRFTVVHPNHLQWCIQG